MSFGVYIHVPFCLKKCPYCTFASVPVAPAPSVRPLPEEDYVKAVLREIESRSPECDGRDLTSVYVGGGTPSLLSPASIGRILSAVTGAIPPPSDARGIEVTLEANPGTITRGSLEGFREAGVTRLSLGLQSLRDDRLGVLGRIHSAGQARDSYTQARAAGFTDINVDLIFGTPGQAPGPWREELAEAVSLRPEHISAYELSAEPGTPLGDLVRRGSLSLPDEDAAAGMHRETWAALAGAGYDHYEISNYALPRRRSRHNLTYWTRGEYLGLGAGAHTFLRSGEAPWGVRWWNAENPSEYMRSVSRVGTARGGEERLTRGQAMIESLFLGLRRLEGLDVREFEALYRADIHREFPSLRDLLERGGLRVRDGRLFLTEEGVLLSNAILAEIVSSSRTDRLPRGIG